MTEENTTTDAIETQTDVIFGEKHLRRRPFLVVVETARPAAGVRTEVKGWMDVPGQVQRGEIPYIVDRVNNEALVSATIIIDLLNRKIVKNRNGSAGPDEQFLSYYMDKYAEQITQGLRVWAQRSALDVSTAVNT